MTALSDRAFHAALSDFAPHFAPDFTDFTLPPAYALGECHECGETRDVRIWEDGLVCQDCDDARPAYDPSDEHDYFNDDPEGDR